MTKNVKNMKVRASGLGTVRDDVSCLAVSRSEASLLLNGTLGCAGKKNNMKKLMITAAAALCASVGFSIESANIVGYATDTIAQNKFVIKAIQFEDVKSGKVDVNSVFTGFTGVDFDEDSVFMTTAPRILVQSAGGYDTYYYLNDAYVEADESTKEGWADGFGNYIDLALTPGTAVWVMIPGGDAATTMAGAVASESLPVTVPAGRFTLVGNAFPVAVTLNGPQMTCDGIKGVDFDEDSAFMTTAPKILVQSAGGYDTYYYLNDAYVEADESTKEGWADGFGNYVEPQVGIGAGFWVMSADDVTLQFNH